MSDPSPNPSPAGESDDSDTPESGPRNTNRQRNALAVLVTAAALLLGGFVFWLQAGLVYSVTLLGSGGLGLQDHLSKAADGLTAGNYSAGEAEYRLALESTQTLDRSLETPQVDFIARFHGGITAVTNWQRVVSAADEITAATGELLSLYGDLSGKNGAQKIFSDGAIDLDR
ncbi:MAG TPA: hypothetical protein VIG24_00380, partial [Acidimicrobiia bacterium]